MNFIRVVILFFYFSLGFAMEVPIYDFPISFSQQAKDYLSPDEQPILSPDYQTRQLKQFYNHYFSTDEQGLSPWSEQMVRSALPLVQKLEPELLAGFNNQNKALEDKHYAENFKEQDERWWNTIKENMDLPAIASCDYIEAHRAISVANTFARALPEEAPDFFHASLPGQGFPFDNLQESAIWAGTPLYVFNVSKDKAWSLVLTPDGYFAWVKSNDMAYVSAEFLSKWQAAAQQSLLAVTQTQTSIMDANQGFQLTGYIGSVFPRIDGNNLHHFILIPHKNKNNQAVIGIGLIDKKSSSLMPLRASPKNMVQIMEQLKNRPYGWGGAFFLNDCSQEMKSLFTPFGIWLPRNSAQQGQLPSTLDLSTNNEDERLNILKEKGHPLMTLIYINGHVMLYVGKKDVNQHKNAAITYQNIWGMSPKNRDKRYVIGQSLFFPLLKYYPENPEVSSLASKSIFRLVFLDEVNVKADSPQGFVKNCLEQFSYLK